jgi:hypothetical protein
MIMPRVLAAVLLLLAPLAAGAQDEVVTLSPLKVSNVVTKGGSPCSGATVIYDTTHASNQGAEIAAAANGPATSLADLIVLGGTDRFVCAVQVDLFTLTDNSPFDATMTVFTDCTTNGAANSPCGNGPGTLIANSTSTLTGLQGPSVGTIFTVEFPFDPPVDLSGEVDNTISVRINPSRSNVLWRIGETPTVGSIPAGEPATSFVQRCGSVGTNNGCSRNFGVNNNFAIQIMAMTTPVELLEWSID